MYSDVIKQRSGSATSSEHLNHSEADQVTKQNKREKFVNAVMISLSLLLVVLYTIYLSYYINLRVT